jgi:3-deoxy-7-phosphoheptulonate synthase
MLIVMKPSHRAEQIAAVVEQIQRLGYRAHVIPGDHSVAVGVTGNTGPLDPQLFTGLDGVQEAIPVTKSYKLAGLQFHPMKSSIKVGGAVFGPGSCALIAGPCAVESEEQTLRIAHAVKAAGAEVLRGGAFKPRTSPYSFQGMGLEGLRILAKAREQTGLPVVTEAVDVGSLALVAEYADIIQIGARNMQNFTLLQEAGKLRKPVMLKRGMSATIDEWLQAAEYILHEGNDQVILCERGLRSFDPQTRNQLDLGAVAVLAQLSHLPVVVDTSHGTGRRPMVAPMARAAVAAGAAGIMVDVHDRPKEALCDGPQAISPGDFAELVPKLRAIARLVEG